ncbi:MAG: thioredoxin family protein [Caldilineaceae bacterium]|nr:thioredoxin family protein [Caldilineaceae bacterium]
MSRQSATKVEVTIYVTPQCPNCDYAAAVADKIRHAYPDVTVRVIDLTATDEPRPDAVFATPTYLLNGRVWSLGNPSDEKIRIAFGTDAAVTVQK